MRFYAVATDFDGTLAEGGRVDEEVVEALQRLRKSGRRPILVTGRILDELREVFDRLDLFDAVVAENGALLYDPQTEIRQQLAPPPPPAFVAALRERGVPLQLGSSIVATREPHEHDALEAIREQGLDLIPIFNKGAVMLLPSSVNKATGLAAQLDLWKLSFHNVAGIGDAENDLAFLDRCELAAAVATALPSVGERCDVVTGGGAGRGVVELIDRIIDDERSFDPLIARRRAIRLGTTPDGREWRVPGARTQVLLAGSSGGGKSTFVTGLFEALVGQQYQPCLIDPEGDYSTFERAVALGGADREPNLDQLAEVLEAGDPAIVILVGVKVEDRVAFGRRLLASIAAVHVRTGRPHWLVVDEAHHLLGTSADRGALPAELGTVFYSTVEPESLASEVRERIEVVIAVGEEPAKTVVAALGDDLRTEAGALPHALPKGQGAAARRGAARIETIELIAGTTAHRRHQRKYALGELGEDESFYFTGPEGKLKLRAGNFMTFLQLASGVDDETWRHHLACGDYSRWIRTAIRDVELADEVAAIEREPNVPARESRDRVERAIRERYTLPVR